MRNLILAVIAMVGVSGAETLTGKVVLSGSNVSSVSTQVCMNGACADVKADGSYSLTVGSSGIQNSKHVMGSDLYRSGKMVMSTSGQAIEVMNQLGRTVAYGNGSVDMQNLPAGVYFAKAGKSVLRLNTMANAGYATSGSSYGTAAGVASRAADTASTFGMAYIVVDGDTLKEIPVTSWNLPTGYMVQRNVTVTTGSMYCGDSAQVVYWDNDSIAYVVSVDLDAGSTTKQYTGFIYAYYDSVSYKSNIKLFSYFARTYKNNAVMAYSNVYDVKGKSGNFSVDSGKFHLTTYRGAGYSLVPARDTVSKWADSAALNYDNSWVSLDSLTTKNVDIYGEVYYMSRPQSNEAIWAVTDSIRVSFNIVDTANSSFKICVPSKMGGESRIWFGIENLHADTLTGGYTTGDTSYTHAVDGLYDNDGYSYVLSMSQYDAAGAHLSPITSLKDVKVYVHVKM